MTTRQTLSRLLEVALVCAFPDSQGLPDTAQIEMMLETPPDPTMGDVAFPCFRLSKILRLAPPTIAQKLAGTFDGQGVATAEAQGPYLNCRFLRASYAAVVLWAVDDRYGASDEGHGRVICLDYSSINIAKRFHIGHLSTTMIGNALKRILDHLGYQTVSINHLGDWGTQFGKLIVAYKRWGTREMVDAGGIDALTTLYVRFHEEAEREPTLEDEGRAWFKKIEDGDTEALSIFSWFKALTLKDAERVYKTLGVTFDHYTGESFYNDKMQAVIDRLTDAHLLIESDGAQVVDLADQKMPPCLIVKSDGATLYATRDLAAAFYRKETYQFEKALYVVAYQQDLHFRQWFSVVEKLGLPWYQDLVHVSYGMVSYEGQALSTRKGHTVYLDELLERAQEKALAIIQEKSPNLEDQSTIARQIGVGAVVYQVLYNSRIKDIDFWWDRALSFEGEAAPYVQYTHARCCSLLRKAGDAGVAPDFTALTGDEAHAVLSLIDRFPDAVREAAQRYEPYLVTRSVTQIAQAFNRFYYAERILDDDPGASAARVSLVKAVQTTIAIGLSLVGIEAPERM